MLNRIVESFDVSSCITLFLSLAHLIQVYIGSRIPQIEFAVLEFQRAGYERQTI